MRLYSGFCGNCSTNKSDFRNLKLSIDDDGTKIIECLDCKNEVQLKPVVKGSSYCYIERDINGRRPTRRDDTTKGNIVTK